MSQSITDIGEVEALEKAWLVGRGGGVPDSGGGVYGNGDNSES